MNYFNSILSPLDRFEIRNLLSIYAPVFGNISLYITNIALYLTISGYIVIMISLLSTKNNKLTTNSLSISKEYRYERVFIRTFIWILNKILHWIIFYINVLPLKLLGVISGYDVFFFLSFTILIGFLLSIIVKSILSTGLLPKFNNFIFLFKLL